MVQNIFDPFFFGFGNFPLIVPEVILPVVGGVVGVVEILMLLIASVVVAMAVIGVPSA